MRPTSASGSATPAGGSSTSPPPRRSTTTRWRGSRRVGRRTVEYHRNRDLYLRKHRGQLAAFLLLRPLLASPTCSGPSAPSSFPATPRAAGCTRQALMPGRGEGIREAADAYNRRIGSPVGG